MVNQTFTKSITLGSAKLYGFYRSPPFRQCLASTINILPIGASSLDVISGALYVQRRRFSSSKEIEFIVTKNSWASEQLIAAGEDLPNGEAIPNNELTKEILYQPTAKVNIVLNNVLALNFLEMNQLVRALQTRLKITDEELEALNIAPDLHMSSGPAGGGGGAAGAAQEKLTFDIKIGAVDQKAKIKVIKEVRGITGLGLKEAKELVEKAPIVIKQGVKKEDVDALKKLLVDAGAEVEVL